MSGNDLESTISDIMKDVDVDIDSSDIKACHRIGKSDWRTASQETCLFYKQEILQKSIIKKKKLCNHK